MKFTLITIAILTFIVSTNAGAYQNGLITGMMVEKVRPTKKEFDKYNTVIIDTALFDFPKQKTPVCRPIQVKQVKYMKLSFVTILMSFIMMMLLFGMIGKSCENDPEFADFMLGYIVGQMLENAFNNDD
tara:strand:+ start:305 stop:691 length:387 start_codon:yes stop_codon:yes gene_type:complete